MSAPLDEPRGFRDAVWPARLTAALTLLAGALPLLLLVIVLIRDGVQDPPLPVVFGETELVEGETAAAGGAVIAVERIERDGGRVCAEVTVTPGDGAGPAVLHSAGLASPDGLVDRDAEWGPGAPPAEFTDPWAGTACFADRGASPDEWVIVLNVGDTDTSDYVAWREQP